MSRVIIQVETEDRSRVKDIDVPTDVIGKELASHLAQAIDWFEPGFRYTLAVKLPPQKTVRPEQSLAEAGLWDGTHLILRRKADINYKPNKPVAKQPESKSPSKELAWLVSKQPGVTYPVTRSGIIIGRSTARTTPAERRELIDLTDEPDSDTVSRKHARLLFEDGNWYLQVHPKTHNRTFCGDKQVESGGKHQLRDDDNLKFGRVILRFKQTNQSEG